MVDKIHTDTEIKIAASLSALIMLLKKKGIITEEESKQLQKDAENIAILQIAKRNGLI